MNYLFDTQPDIGLPSIFVALFFISALFFKIHMQMWTTKQLEKELLKTILKKPLRRIKFLGVLGICIILIRMTEMKYLSMRIFEYTCLTWLLVTIAQTLYISKFGVEKELLHRNTQRAIDKYLPRKKK